MRSVRFVVALLATWAAAWWAFLLLVGPRWRMAAAFAVAGAVGGVTFTLVNDGPRALAGALWPRPPPSGVADRCGHVGGASVTKHAVAAGARPARALLRRPD